MSRERRILLLGNGRELWKGIFQGLETRGLEVRIFNQDCLPVTEDCRHFDIIVLSSEIICRGKKNGDRYSGFLSISPHKYFVIVQDSDDKYVINNIPSSLNIHCIEKPFTASSIVLEIVNLCSIQNKPDSSTTEVRFEDLIRFCKDQRMDLVLEIYTNKDSGRIYFEDGRAVHAKTDDNFGNKAYYEMQFWEPTDFQISHLNTCVIHSLNSNISDEDDSRLTGQLDEQGSDND